MSKLNIVLPSQYKANLLYLTSTVSSAKFDSLLAQVGSYLDNKQSDKSNSLINDLPLFKFASLKTKLNTEPIHATLNKVKIDISQYIDPFLIDFETELFNHVIYYIAYYSYCNPFKFFDETGSETAYLNLTSAVDSYLQQYINKFLGSVHKSSLEEVEESKLNNFWEIVLGDKAIIEFRDNFLNRTPYLLEDNYEDQQAMTLEEVKSYVYETTMRLVEVIKQHNKYNKIITYVENSLCSVESRVEERVINNSTMTYEDVQNRLDPTVNNITNKVSQVIKSKTHKLTQLNRTSLINMTEIYINQSQDGFVIFDQGEYKCVAIQHSKSTKPSKFVYSLGKNFSTADVMTQALLTFINNYINNSETGDLFSAEESKIQSITVNVDETKLDIKQQQQFLDLICGLFGVESKSPSKSLLLNCIRSLTTGLKEYNLAQLCKFVVENYKSWMMTQTKAYQKFIDSTIAEFTKLISSAGSIQTLYLNGCQDNSDKLSILGPETYNKFIDINPVVRAVEYMRVTIGTTKRLEQIYRIMKTMNDPTALNILNASKNEHSIKDIIQMYITESGSDIVVTTEEIQMINHYKLTQTQPIYNNNVLFTRELIVTNNGIDPQPLQTNSFKFKLFNKTIKAKQLGEPSVEVIGNASSITMPIYKYVAEFKAVPMPITKLPGYNLGLLITKSMTMLIHTKMDYTQGLTEYY